MQQALAQGMDDDDTGGGCALLSELWMHIIIAGVCVCMLQCK